MPEEAETVRRIYRSYLRGASLGIIERELIADGIPTAEGVKNWSRQVIRNILTNKKYAGDALLQKTYVTDCISKKVRKNNGERPVYAVENHHKSIVKTKLTKALSIQSSEKSCKRPGWKSGSVCLLCVVAGKNIKKSVFPLVFPAAVCYNYYIHGREAFVHE